MIRPALLLGALGALSIALFASPLWADTILAPGDFIIAIDTDPAGSNSSYPGGEAPANTVDGTLAKYLNFAGPNSGFIVTPAFGSSQVQSFTLTTANDAEGRDPATWELFGTNDAIASLDNSMGTDENWILLDSGAVVLPAARDTLGPVVPVVNANAYTSYKMMFPTLKGDPIMQIAEASFYQSTDGTGTDVLAAGDPVLAVHSAPNSRYPGNEDPPNAIDLTTDKYLNFGKENSGFIVTPSKGASVVRSFQITTANDFDVRDPSSWELYGTNDAIVSEDNSQGTGENWTLIDSGTVNLPTERHTAGPYVIVDNETPYASYKMIFPTVRNPSGDRADSMQISEIQFFDVAIPEPSAFVLAGLILGFIGLAVRRYR